MAMPSIWTHVHDLLSYLPIKRLKPRSGVGTQPTDKFTEPEMLLAGCCWQREMCLLEYYHLLLVKLVGHAAMTGIVEGLPVGLGPVWCSCLIKAMADLLAHARLCHRAQVRQMPHSWRQLCQDVCLSQRLHRLPLCDRHLHQCKEVEAINTFLMPRSEGVCKPSSDQDSSSAIPEFHQQVNVITCSQPYQVSCQTASALD